MNRRRVLKILGITGVGLTAAGVVAKNYWDGLQANLRSNLLISGSAPMASYIKKIADAYTLKRKNIDIVVEKGHSSGAFLALNRGGIDLAVMDRNLNPEEFNLIDHNYLTGIDGLGIVVHPESPVTNISLSNARKIFEGIITNWKDVGGPDATIRMFGRMEGSTTRDSIEDILMDGGVLSRKIKELKSSGDVSKAVAADINAIGYVSVRTMQDITRALSINGVELNEKNLLINRYPLYRAMFLVIKGDGTDSAKKFIDFSLSEQGQKVLADTGMLRVR